MNLGRKMIYALPNWIKNLADKVPIYRAKSLEKDEYVYGFLYQDKIGYTPPDETGKDNYFKELEKDSWYIMNNKSMNTRIDYSTIAININRVKDKDNNLIFGSISTTGKVVIIGLI